jgi:Ran GTPase-activating protein (RanGAP) involved in mRNA processing and transport
VVGHCVAHYQFQWELNCRGASMGGEELEMLLKGMASSTGSAWNGKIECIFCCNDISLEGIKWFMKIPLQLAQQITKLDLDSNKLDQDALNAFCGLIPKLTKLQVLSLWDNPIGNGGAVEVLKCLHHCKTPLKELNLAHTGVGEEDCAQLALLVANSNLTRLYIENNSLSSNSVAIIMEGLLQNNTIQDLNMGGSHFSEENCVSLASLLQQAECQLRKLVIQECSISGEGAAHLAAALTNNHSLTELFISYNPIGDIGAAAFGDLVSNNTALKTLRIDECEITSAGCIQLAAGLTENIVLQKLAMWGNNVGVDGAKALSVMIAMNQTLRELYLHDDHSLGEGVDSLLASLQNNTTLRWLTLSYWYKRPADPRVEWQ